MSCLPLGLNQIEISEAADPPVLRLSCTIHHTELFQNGKEALYYGINALSNNPIMVIESR